MTLKDKSTIEWITKPLKKPDFLIGGATRSGVTALTQILQNHKQIHIPTRKKHKFFNHENLMKNYYAPVKREFEDAVNTEYKILIPEGRVLHGEHQYDPQRAYDACPRTKVIFSLRNPVDRAYAQYYHALVERRETARTFEEAIDQELAGDRTPETHSNCWIFKNRYEQHIKDWLAFYKKNKILITIHEEWSDNSKDALHPIESFLGLKNGSLSLNKLEGFDRQSRFLNMRSLQNKKIPQIDSITRQHTEDLFKVDQLFIARFLGRDIPSWNVTGVKTSPDRFQA